MEAHILQQDYQENRHVTSYTRPYGVGPSHPQIASVLPSRTPEQTSAPHSVHSSSSDLYSSMHGRTHDGSVYHQPALTQYPQPYGSSYAQVHGGSHVHSIDASESHLQVREHSSSRDPGDLQINGISHGRSYKEAYSSSANVRHPPKNSSHQQLNSVAYSQASTQYTHTQNFSHPQKHPQLDTGRRNLCIHNSTLHYHSTTAWNLLKLALNTFMRVPPPGQ